MVCFALLFFKASILLVILRDKNICFMKKIILLNIDVGPGAQGLVSPHFSQFIRQIAFLQLKRFSVLVYEFDPKFMCPPHFLNASYASAS